MFSLVTSLIDIPSSQGVTHRERGEEELLLSPVETLGEEGMQLPGILHAHLKSPKSSLARRMLRSVRAQQTPVQNTLWTRSLWHKA